tara:strand:+ start:312 stop:614 length:303 start_codon:yes stop_codon:yes gene_type:complete
MYQVTIINTFPSDNDCDMFIMVLQQQWPNFINKLPKARMDIYRSDKERNVMNCTWTFQSKEQAAEMQDIADNIILPYRKKLMPKVVRFEGEFVATVDNDD